MNQLYVLGKLVEYGPMTTSEIVDRFVKPASYERNVAMVCTIQRLKALSRSGCVVNLGDVPYKGGRTKLWEATEDGRRHYELNKEVKT